jgi:cytochrome b561
MKPASFTYALHRGFPSGLGLRRLPARHPPRACCPGSWASYSSVMNTSIPISSVAETYDSRTVKLHWISAVLVMVLWLLGQSIDSFPKGTPRVTVRSLHIAIGVLLGLVLALRLVWRRSGGAALAPADPGFLGKISVGVHHLLYVLLLASVIAGLVNVWIRGDAVFNWFTVPEFDPGNKALRHNAGELHEFLANTLLIVAGLHALAAVWHHRVLKDGVLRRMWPGLAPVQSDSRDSR